MTYSHAAMIYNQFQENIEKIKDLKESITKQKSKDNMYTLAWDEVSFLLFISDEYTKLMNKKMCSEINE